jgi:hypothetical protein
MPGRLLLQVYLLQVYLLQVYLLQGIELARWVYLSPAKKSFSGSSVGILDWISE